MKRSLAGAVLMALATALGCASGQNTQRSGPRQVTQVIVENSNWMDVTVYAVHNGNRQRLGMVTTNRTRTFDLPDTFIASGGNVQLLVDPIGSMRAQLMPAVTVNAGDRISLDVFNHLPLSAVSVLPRGFSHR